MAGSRWSNFGSIFSRTTGLLETGASKETPLWYNVYKKYPPAIEPRTDRPLPSVKPILEIVYEEDFERAKESKLIKANIKNYLREQDLKSDYISKYDTSKNDAKKHDVSKKDIDKNDVRKNLTRKPGKGEGRLDSLLKIMTKD